MESNSHAELRSTRKPKRGREPTTPSRQLAIGAAVQTPGASSDGNSRLVLAKRPRRSTENGAAGVHPPGRLTDDLIFRIATFTSEEQDRIRFYVAVGPRFPALRKNLAGLALYARAKNNNFFRPYYEQDPEVVLPEEKFAALAEQFTDPFIQHVVNPNKTPACCITPEKFQTFLQPNSQKPGAYQSGVFVKYNSLRDVLDGRIEFPSDVGQKYRDDIFTLVRETLEIVDRHCATLGIDPAVTNPFVAILYAGLTVFNVAWNPEAEDDPEIAKGRMQQHIAGGFSTSLNSALIAFFTQGKRFRSEEFRHVYGLAAACEFGDVPTAAALELFEAVGLVREGKSWTFSDGETTNKACVGLVSGKKGKIDSLLWEDVWRLRIRVGHDILLTDDAVPNRLVDIARHSVLRKYIAQTHALQKDADPAAITLRQFSSAISAHASAVNYGIGMDDERAAALISSVPREELLDSLCCHTPKSLNRLIQEHKVECGTFGQHCMPYERVRKIVSEHFEVDILGRARERAKRAEAEREQRAKRAEATRRKREQRAQEKATLRKRRMEHLARVDTYDVNFTCFTPFGMDILQRKHSPGMFYVRGACVGAVREGGQAHDLCVLEGSTITQVGRSKVGHLKWEEIVELIRTEQKKKTILTIHFKKSV